jgi:hypothetical protein
MLWLLGSVALVGGEGCGWEAWVEAAASPPPMRDEMDMLLPGRCDWPSAGTSLLGAKEEVKAVRCECECEEDMCC